MVKKKSKIKEDAWFKKSVKSAKWGWNPINWKGWVAVLLLVEVNVFAANYFYIKGLTIDSWFKFGTVFLISLFVFITIAKRKTQWVKVEKK